jgi:predicted transcriptional regulator
LGDGLARLLLQEFGVPKEGREMADQLDVLRARVPALVDKDPGLKIGEIGDRLGVPIEMAQVVVRPLLAEDTLETTGARKGTRYYLAGRAPKRGSKVSS